MQFGRWGVASVLLCAGLAFSSSAQACGIDGVPSLSVNGSLAHLNLTRPSRSNLGTWAQFVFPHPFKLDQTVQFSENVVELKRTLQPQALGRPWRWSFGDGSAATGFAVHHIYTHPGRYKVVISAYYNSYKAWFQFDNALIAIATH